MAPARPKPVESASVTRELAEAHERESAVAEILEVISRSRGDVQPVFGAVLEKAIAICEADNADLLIREGDGLRFHLRTGTTDREEETFRALAAASDAQSPAALMHAGRNTLAGRVLLDGHSVQIEDVANDPDYDPAAKKVILERRTSVIAMLGVPLLCDGEINGAIVLRRRAAPFTDRQIRVVETFARQAVIAIENARLFHETKEALEQQTATADVLRVITESGFDLQPVFQSIVEHAVRLCEADNASLFRHEGDIYRHVAIAGEASDEARTYMADRPVVPGRSTLSGRVAMERRSVQIPDFRLDLEYLGAPPGARHRAGLGVPILRGDELLGVIVARRYAPGPFGEAAVKLLETFADQAAIAIENVRLFHETKEALEQQIAISDVLKAISQAKSDIQPVFDTINDHAARLCHAPLSALFQVDGERLPLASISQDAPPALIEMLRRNPPRIDRAWASGRAVMERRTIHVLDALADPEYARVDMAEAGGYRTVLAVPLLRDGVPIGALGLTRTEVRPFTDREVRLVETFAAQAVIAIENVRLFRAVERQREELTRFVSPQVASLLTSDEGQRLLEGHRRAISVLFCDLRGFSAFSETAEPEEVLDAVRAYHAAMGELIVAHGGTLEHFAGDGMMVFFNDPVPVAEHELKAVRLAVAMRERFAELAQAWHRKGYQLGLGIGVAVGQATLGRIGFEGRYDYGAIGNAVIVASRLSGEAKAGQILLTQRLLAAVESHVVVEAVGELVLKGQSRPVAAFNVTGLQAPS